MTELAVDFEAVRRAHERIRPFVHRTPVLTSSTFDEMAGRSLLFKCENLQRVGAFKMRGATSAVTNLSDDVARHGVVTHSSGNFAQALALAARLRGIPAHIVMPGNAPGVKRAAVEGYGATIYTSEPNVSAREALAEDVLERTGGTFLHPYDHPDVIAGQGTCALELLEQVPDLDAVVAPVGGGGLMGGICVAAFGSRPGIRLFGAEPAGADDAARSLAAGERLPQTDPRTLADGLRTGLGQLTWPILHHHLESIVTVSEESIIDAMYRVWQRMKIVIEPSAAVAVAAVLTPGFRALDGLERVGVVLSGGNADLDSLPW
jgi:threonine dehydratase